MTFFNGPNFKNTNMFFLNNVYTPMFYFSISPTLLLNLSVDKDKKISDYNIQDISKTSLIGLFFVLPLTKITLSISLFLSVFVAIAHACIGLGALIDDTFEGLHRVRPMA